MSAAHSTPAYTRSKPEKPYPAFPPFAHAAGVWAKKIRGRIHYFGSWANPDGALAKYLAQKDDLHAGRTPRPDAEALTIKELGNEYLAAQEALVDTGELSRLTWGDYKTACDEIVAAFGKIRLVDDLSPDDFAGLRQRMTRKWGPHRLNTTIQFVRCVFKWGFDTERIDKAVRFGPDFKRPSKKVFRLHRAKQGPKLLTADEIRQVLNAAGAQLRAMTVLEINAGLGNSDIGNLRTSHIDFDQGTLTYPRPKTGIGRRCILWPETIAAIKAAMARRPIVKKPEHADLVFVTRCGDTWHTGTTDGPLSREFGKLLRRLKINGRKGLGFYTLRHTYRTIADESRDQVAVDYTMGHVDDSMAGHYRETISDQRLRAVADHVRAWLFGVGQEGGAE